MFQGFANIWTPVARSKELERKPLAVRVAGEPVVLFRGAGLGAFIDRCPHRGVALSLGRVSEQGCLVCPFHHWSFESSGRCANIPLNGPLSDDKRRRYAATALPVRELGGFIWIYTGLEPADCEPAPPDFMVDPAWHCSVYSEIWNVHWTRAMENMLDMPHAPFVHPRSNGRGLRAAMRPDSVLRMSVTPAPFGARIYGHLDDAPQGPFMFEWRRPHGIRFDASVPDSAKGHQLNVWCVPVDDTHVRLIVVVGRNYKTLRSWLQPFKSRRILREDRAIVESSQPSEVPPPADETSVAADAPTLFFRRYYYRELRADPASFGSLIPGDLFGMK